MNYFFVDFETRSKADLRKVGAWNYAADPSTEVISTAVARNDKPVEHIKGGEYVGFPGTWTYVAHNIEFERAILHHKFKIFPEHFLDTMALAAQLSLPLSLEKLAEFFGLKKDMEGHRVMLKLSRPRRPSRDNSDEFWERETKPDDYADLDDYNVGDVEVMRQVFYKMLPLTKREQRVWQLTCEMNNRGIHVDLPAVRKAKELVEREAATLSAEFRETVGCSPQSSVKVAAWAGLPDVTATTVEATLRNGVRPDVRRVLELRQLLSHSSLAKLDSLLCRTSTDGRLVGSLVYAGAQRTGRWASRGVQLQNLPRGLGEWAEIAVDCMLADWRADSWLKLMPQMLRSFFKGPFIVGDFSQIEARIVAWLAGEKKLLKDFTTKADPYRRMAAAIYGVPKDQVTADQRFIGKQTVLGCGYQMGADKFINAMKKYHKDIPREEADRIIATYRAEHPAIKSFWYMINGKAIDAMYGRPNDWFETCSVRGVPYLRCRLPSGRHLYYPKPRLGTDPKFGVERVEYFGQNTYTRQWEMVGAYGGKLTENITQATARDVMADAMFRIQDGGFHQVLTVHDEVVAEGRDEQRFKQLMKEVPEWATGCPIDVEVFACERYRK